jgi:hypothetical protein
MKRFSVLLAFLMLPSPVLAVEWKDFSLNGFGTLGVSCLSSKNADYTYNSVPRGPGNSSQLITYQFIVNFCP